MGVHNLEVYPEIKQLLGIPDDEPIFILRAKDNAAVDTLFDYRTRYDLLHPSSAGDRDFIDGIDGCIDAFEAWRGENPEMCKVPD